MNIAITGTHGIPNRYGGFEAFTEKLSGILVSLGHKVFVYTPDTHPWQESRYNGVELIRIPFHKKGLGTAATLAYDRLCFSDVLYRKPDIILNCGTPGALFIQKKIPPVITLADGLEWQRRKWNIPGKTVLRITEKKAVARSVALVTDHPEMARYFKNRYGIQPVYIPYGADIPEQIMPVETFKKTVTSLFPALKGISPGHYFLSIARFEPENNLSMIAEGFLQSSADTDLIIIGNPETKYGKKLFKRACRHTSIHFAGGIYDRIFLDALRFYSRGYFHGHSVGGTNPSLLEAMAAGCLIAAHKNPFNQHVLGDNSPYFSSADDLAGIIAKWDKMLTKKEPVVSGYLARIRVEYNWKKVARAYLDLFNRVVNNPSFT